MLFVTLVGLTMATQLVAPNLFVCIPYLVFGRIRLIHMNGGIFAWLTMMYFAGSFYVLPRLLGRECPIALVFGLAVIRARI